MWGDTCDDGHGYTPPPVRALNALDAHMAPTTGTGAKINRGRRHYLHPGDLLPQFPGGVHQGLSKSLDGPSPQQKYFLVDYKGH